MICLSVARTMTKCPLWGGVHLLEVFISRGLTVPTTFSSLLLLLFHQQAILTFEDDQLDRALENVKRAQRVCYVENARKGAALRLDEMLMRQILYADCELYMALLTFLKQGKISMCY